MNRQVTAALGVLLHTLRRRGTTGWEKCTEGDSRHCGEIESWLHGGYPLCPFLSLRSRSFHATESSAQERLSEKSALKSCLVALAVWSFLGEQWCALTLSRREGTADLQRAPGPALATSVPPIRPPQPPNFPSQWVSQVSFLAHVVHRPFGRLSESENNSN